MRREGLRRRLAVCILDTLCQHRLTPPNVRRYVTPSHLSLYRIRSTTKITPRDYDVAMLIALNISRKSNSYRYAPRGSPKAVEREKLILTAPLVDLLKPS